MLFVVHQYHLLNFLYSTASIELHAYYNTYVVFAI